MRLTTTITLTMALLAAGAYGGSITIDQGTISNNGGTCNSDGSFCWYGGDSTHKYQTFFAENSTGNYGDGTAWFSTVSGMTQFVDTNRYAGWNQFDGLTGTGWYWYVTQQESSTNQSGFVASNYGVFNWSQTDQFLQTTVYTQNTWTNCAVKHEDGSCYWGGVSYLSTFWVNEGKSVNDNGTFPFRNTYQGPTLTTVLGDGRTQDSAAPEPSTYAMLGLGAAGLLASRVRRRGK